MNRLFIRILSWMLLALLAAMAGIFAVTNLFYDRLFADPKWYPVRHTAALVQRIINETPVADIFEERDRLQALLDRDIDIFPAGKDDADIGTLQALSETEPVYADNFFYIQVHNGAYVLRISPSFRQSKPLLKPISIFISCLVTTVVTVIVGFLFTYPVARRLRKLEIAAEKIRQGDIGTRVADSHRDLIGKVGTCFNQMADRIQLLVLVRRHLLNEVARKFQTPILKIGRYLKELRNEKDTSEVEKRSRKIDRAVNDIEHLVTGLLLNKKIRRSETDPPHDAVAAGKTAGTSWRRRYSVSKFIGRMSLGILSVLLLHQLFMLGVSQIAYDYLNTDPSWYPVRTIAALIGRVVEEGDRENRTALIESLRKNLERDIELVSAESVPALSGSTLREFDGGMTYGVYHGREVYRLPISDSRVLLVDPAYALYRRHPSLFFHSFSLVFEFLLTAVFGVLLSLPIIRNIQKLEEGIERIRRDELGARVDIPTNKPIGSLAQCLNHMVRRIESLLEHQRHLIQAVAHEIRTPVSRIRFHLEMLSEADQGQNLNQLVTDIEMELDELNLLVRELMTLSALDAMEKEPSTSPVLLYQTLSGIIAAYRKTHPQIRIDLSDTIPRGLSVTVHPVFFKRAVQNILSNAVRHAESNVHLTCDPINSGIRIEIKDDGPGIPEQNRNIVFQPFTRLDGSRSRTSGGFGLGLAIVSRIIALHGGTVSIKDNVPRGACITTFWPNPAKPEARSSRVTADG